eukprot:5488454-Pyramimonas_sp.AAC.1
MGDPAHCDGVGDQPASPFPEQELPASAALLLFIGCSPPKVHDIPIAELHLGVRQLLANIGALVRVALEIHTHEGPFALCGKSGHNGPPSDASTRRLRRGSTNGSCPHAVVAAPGPILEFCERVNRVTGNKNKTRREPSTLLLHPSPILKPPLHDGPTGSPQHLQRRNLSDANTLAAGDLD